jgi:glycosyltransferase involved in cell wall biosynthesis
VTFVGAFDERKGLRQLLAAWPQVLEARPGTPLRLLGKGGLARLALDAQDAYDDVTVLLDPERSAIHEAMRSSKVVVLLSQPSATWREQVGLPIVEGLSHGCEIVTTTETGLADWLREHGHQVLDARTSGPAEVAAAVHRSLDADRTPADVVTDLPPEDGRLAADRWMFARDHPEPSGT